MGSHTCLTTFTSAKTNTGQSTNTQCLMNHKSPARYARQLWAESLQGSHLASSAKTSIQMIKMPRFNQPCTVCGGLVRGASLCETHARERNQRKERARQASPQREEKKRNLYNYAYRQAAKALRETATHCHICKEPFRQGDRVEADHLIPGSNEGGLAAAHRLCNQRRGAKPL